MAQVNLGRVTGYSAYEIAVENGFVGTEQEWLASLKGAKGDTGSAGPQGEVGPAGPAGSNGTNGQDGADGTTFTPSVSAEGVISWTNDGGKTNPQSVNIKGPAGTTQWSGIEDKPFSTIGTGLSVSEGVLSATGGSGSSIRRIVVSSTSSFINGISADDRLYLYNLIQNGYDQYPCYLDYDGNIYTYIGGGNPADVANFIYINNYNWSNRNSNNNAVYQGWQILIRSSSNGTAGNIYEYQRPSNYYTAGTGIDITNNVISATGGSDAGLDIVEVVYRDNLLRLNTEEDVNKVNDMLVNGYGTHPICFTAPYSSSINNRPCYYYITNITPSSIIALGTEGKQLQITLSNNTVSISSYVVVGNGLVGNNITAAQSSTFLPSGNLGSTVANEFKYIKDNYATKAELSSIPECPTTADSTFQLQCVVSNGVPTYSWVDVAPHPILTNFWLGINDTEIIGNGDVQGEINQEGKYFFTWNGTLSQALDDQTVYTKSIEVQYGQSQSGDDGNAMFSWDSQLGFWGFAGGPSIVRIIPEGGDATATTGQIIILYDPDWQPPADTVEQVSLVDVSSGNSLYNASNLGITDVGGVWTIQNAELASALSSGQELDVWVNGSNVPSVSSSRVTLAAIPDTPNLTATASPWTMTFYPQSGTTYNIALSTGGQN